MESLARLPTRYPMRWGMRGSFLVGCPLVYPHLPTESQGDAGFLCCGQNGGMAVVHAVLGDITAQEVDAVVNAANRRMRGGGGVDGAIHRVGGPEVLADCIRRFPDGLATGDAGWTTAGDLPARWVIHTVGPNHAAGERVRSLLESCYRRSLQVADELGARSIAFPLISAGIYAWPLDDAIATAVRTILAADTDVAEVRLVAREPPIHAAIERELREGAW